MQLIAGCQGKGGALDCNHSGLREQEPAQPVAEGVQGAAGDSDADAIRAALVEGDRYRIETSGAEAAKGTRLPRAFTYELGRESEP